MLLTAGIPETEGYWSSNWGRQSVSTAEIPEPESIWRPNWGGQFDFFQCPVWEVLAHGDRGGGKTDSLLHSFLRYVNKGFDEDWRGIIFRLTYPQLKDLIDRSLFWIPRMGEGAAYNRSEHEWSFPRGEKLMFRHLENLSSYYHYHGHSYCLAEDEKVMTPLGDVPIQDLVPGHPIYTPSGVSHVNRVFQTGYRPCVRISLYDSYSGSVFQQRQSVDHRILTIAGWQRSQSLPTYCIFLPQHQLKHLEAYGRHHAYGRQESSFSSYQKPSHPSICQSHLIQLWGLLQTFWQSGRRSWCYEGVKFQTDVGQDRMVWREFLEGTQNSYEECHGLFQGNRLLLEPFDDGVEHQELVAQLYGFHRQVPILSRCSCKSCELSQEIKANLTVLYSDLQQRPLPFQLLLADDVLNDTSYAQIGSPLSPDLTGDYSPYYDPCDEFLPQDTRNVQSRARLLGDAQRLYLDHLKMDETSYKRQYSLYHQRTFLPHPYGKEAIETYLPLDHGYITSEPCGILKTYDIEVDGDNCYFTTSGIINKNCFLGFEELTNWPTPEPYEAMLSCSRKPRSTSVAPLLVRATTNSFGVGHSWVKQRFVMGKEPLKSYGERGRQRARIPMQWIENKPFVEADPDYHARLAESIANEAQRKAWLEDSWDIVAGGRFSDVWRESVHFIEPFNIPYNWIVDRSFDWGSSSPFATLWYAESNGESLIDGRSWPKGTLFVISEDYGCAGDMNDVNWKPNVGLRLDPVEIARRIKAREEEMLTWGLIGKKPRPGPADLDLFDVSRGTSMAKQMNGQNVVWQRASKGPGSRVTGWQLIETMLNASLKHPMEESGLFIFNTCVHLRRTLPILPRDDKNPDDVATDSEDHLADSLRYRILYGKRGPVVRGVNL